MRADQDGRIPVPALGGLSGSRLRLDVNQFIAVTPVAVDLALLILHVTDVFIGRVESHVVAVRTERNVPVLVSDTLGIQSAGGAKQRAQVLGAAQDIVKRQRVIHRQLVKLRNGEIGEMPPGCSLVKTFIQPGIAAGQQVIVIVRIDPQRMVVAVFFAPGAQHAEVFAAVTSHVKKDIHLVHQVRVLRRGGQFLVVVRSRAAGNVVVHLGPALALVF